MSVSQTFIDAIDANDIFTARILIVVYMHDTTQRELHDLLNYVPRSFPLFDQHDGQILESDTSKWSEMYLEREKSILLINFSVERLHHIQDVISYVHRENISKNINNTQSAIQQDVISQTTVVIMGGAVVIGTLALIGWGIKKLLD